MRSRTMHAAHARGSALIITVGTLALIAVFAALYVTLGQSDTRMAETVDHNADVSRVEDQIARYIAGVVGDDRLDVTVDTITGFANEVGPYYDPNGTPIPADESRRQRFIREATDYPYTDYTFKSVFSTDPLFDGTQYGNVPDAFNGAGAAQLSLAAERFRFNPTGDHGVMLDLPSDTLSLDGQADAVRDFRVASDPWLASSEPTFLGRPETGLAIDQRLFSLHALQTSSTNNALQDEFHYLDNRDWRQISNLAPDGLSVNLFNLRGNFEAEPGLGVDPNGRYRMSENRTLLSLNNPDAQNPTPDQLRLRASDRLPNDPDGVIVSSFLDQTNQVALAIRNTPAWWTMNQRFLYFPADPSFAILGRPDTGTLIGANLGSLVVQTWDTPDYPDYQYADADGDGFYDSRWFELTDSTMGFLGTTSLLDNDTDMRFFIAARVVDLSARVNVNSATDSLVPPTSKVPAGATPAEIDLRRLLTMQDPAVRYRPVFENVNSNPPSAGQQRLSLAHIEPLPFAQQQNNPNNSNRLVAADYSNYITANAVGTFFLGFAGMETGRYAYDAIRREIQGDPFGLPADATNLRAAGSGELLRDTTPFEYFDFKPAVQGVMTDPGAAQLGRMPRWRRDYWHAAGGANIADAGDPPISALGLGGRLFGLDDLSELLTFNGVNDDTTLSRLERVTQGRFESNTGTDLSGSTLRFGPLRANRPTALERAGHDNQINSVSAFTSQSVTGDDLVDYESMALAALDVRRRLTTISGAAPLRSRVVEDLDRDGVLSDDERRLTDADARLDLVFDAGDPAALFALYADALAPYAEADDTWNVDPEGELVSRPSYRQMRTLAYGHRGSELALRLSAHLAVNMADLYDEDDTPSAYTVLAMADAQSNDIRGDLDRDWPLTLKENDPLHWWADGKKLDLGDEKLAPTAADLSAGVASDYSRLAYNVFGVEPQPFITEVAVMTMYCDIPRASITGLADNGFDGVPLVEDENVGDHPGNNENWWGLGSIQGQTAGDDDLEVDDVTVRTDISPENPDLIFHVLAVQLTNPFDVPIRLSGRDTDNANDGGALNSADVRTIEDAKFYLEFNGHFFPLAEYFERDPDINPATENPYTTDGPRVAGHLYAVTLEPGESRVFYVSAHPWVEGMNLRWIAIDKVYGNPVPGNFNGIFQDPLPDMSNRNPFEEFLATQFTVTDAAGRPMVRDNQFDARGPVRLIEFNPVDGSLAAAGVPESSGGTFTDFLRTSLAFRDPGNIEGYTRMRQEVRLWRKMTVDDSTGFTPTNAEDTDYDTSNTNDAGVNSGINWIENDLLVDRMRDPLLPRAYTFGEQRASLDYAVYDHTSITGRPATSFYTSWNDIINPSGTITSEWNTAQTQAIPLTTATEDTTGIWSNTNQGLTFVRFAGYRRPDHLSRTAAGDLNPVLDGNNERSLRGLLPAWCVEGVESNYNIITPIESGFDPDTDNDGAADEPSLAYGALDAIENVTVNGEKFGYNGSLSGGTGSPRPGGDLPPFFSKILRKTLVDTIPQVELDSANANYIIPDTPLIPTLRRHPALKSERGIEDPTDFSAVMASAGAAGNLLVTDRGTPSLLGDLNAGAAQPSVMDDRESLLFNNSDRFGFDGEDPRTAGVRLGDLLMPLGVGASFHPRLTHTTANGEPWNWSAPENFRPGDWTTLAEALSAALGLEPPAFYNKDPGDPGYSLLCELCEKKPTINQPTAYDPPAGTPPNPANQLAVTTPKNQVEFILNRGRLDPDAYTPFYNRSFVYPGGGFEDLSPVFIAGEPGVGDRRVALSVPPAQRLLSMAQAITRGGDPLTTPVIGTININTAPDTVLRTIPGFSTSLQFTSSWVDYDKYDVPAEGIVSPFVGANLMEWAPGRVAGKTFAAHADYNDFSEQTPVRPLPFGIGDPFAINNPWRNRADIAPALSAFRDRTSPSFTLASVNPTTYANGFNQSGAFRPRKIFDFNPSYEVLSYAFGLTVGSPALPDNRALMAQNYALDMSRSAINGEFASIETPGLAGTGSLLGVSIYKRDPLSPVGGPNIANPRFTTGFGANSWGQAVRDQAIQGTATRYAWDDLVMAAKDQDLNGDADPNGDGAEQILFTVDPNKDDNFSYTVGRGLFLNENPDRTNRKRALEDELEDDLLEKLAIFNGAANTIDTRSDFFAAWFIIRGYRESDVEGLDAGEPMTPTYQKRFLMVIDRSNVTDLGQQPRILLLREVPL